MKRLVLLVAACGGSSPGQDASGPDAVESSGSVTVMVTDHGRPVAGAPVFFRSADGAASFSAVTSAMGESGFNLSDGTVTVLLPKLQFGIDQLSTFTDVKPGDVLHLDLAPLGPRSVEVDVTVNGSGPTVLYTTCDGEEPFGLEPGKTTRIALQCAPGRADFLAVQLDSDTNAPIASQFISDVDLDTTPLVALGGTFASVAIVNVSYTNPNNFDFISTTQTIRTPRGELFRSTVGSTRTQVEPVVLAQPAPPADAFLGVASSGFPLAGDFDEQVIYTTQAMASPLVVNLEPRLPQYASLGEVRGGKVAWTERANGTVVPTMVRARVRFYREDIPQGVTWTWQVIAPRKASPEVAFPPLPAEAMHLQPVDTDTAAIEELTSFKLPGSYDQVRPDGFADANAFAPTTNSQTLVVQRRYVPE